MSSGNYDSSGNYSTGGGYDSSGSYVGTSGSVGGGAACLIIHRCGPRATAGTASCAEKAAANFAANTLAGSIVAYMCLAIMGTCPSTYSCPSGSEWKWEGIDIFGAALGCIASAVGILWWFLPDKFNQFDLACKGVLVVMHLTSGILHIVTMESIADYYRTGADSRFWVWLIFRRALAELLACAVDTTNTT